MTKRFPVLSALLCALAVVGSALPVQAFDFYLFSNYKSTFVDCYGAGSSLETTENLPTKPTRWSTDSNYTIKANELAGYRFLGWYTKHGGWGNVHPTEITAESVDAKPFVATPEISGTKIQSAGTAQGGLCVIVAKYVKLHTLTIAIDPAGAGTVSTNGVAVNEVIVEDGGSVTLKATANAGYAFEKWSDGNTDNPRTVSKVSAPTTYTAVFKQLFKTVALEKTGGTGGTDSVVVTNGMALPKITVPTRAGYDFKGYYTSETGDGATQYYTSGGQGARIWAADEETCALYARWEGKKFKLEFNDQGADKKSGQGTKEVVYGENPGPVAIPTKSNYTFIGYFYNDVRYWDENGTWSGGAWTASDRTVEIFARYQADSYTIKFDRNGGTEGSYTDLTKNVDEQFALPDGKALSYERHAFAGWALSEGGEKKFDGGATTTVADNISSEPPNPKVLTFYAVWTDLSRTVRFNVGSAEATATPETQLVAAGGKFGELATASWQGDRCTHAGWRNADGQAVTLDDTVPMGAGEIVLFAQWTTNGYAVAYDGRGQTSGEMNEQAFRFYVPQKLTPNAFVKTGYAFRGWSTNASETVDYADAALVEHNLCQTKDERITLSAVWKANDYTVRFYGNGGTNEMAAQAFQYDVAQGLSSNQFVREDFTFAGWATDPTNGVAYADGATVSNLTATADGEVRLYAKWASGGTPVDSELSRAIGANVNLTTNSLGWTIAEGEGEGGRPALRMNAGEQKNDQDMRHLSAVLNGPGRLTFRYKTVINGNPIPEGGSDPDEPSVFVFNRDSTSTGDAVELAKLSVDWTTYAEYEKTSTGATTIEWYIRMRNSAHPEDGTYGPCGSDNDYALIDFIRWDPAVTNALLVGVTFRDAEGGVFMNVTRKAGEQFGDLPTLKDETGLACTWTWKGAAVAPETIVPYEESVEILPQWTVHPMPTEEDKVTISSAAVVDGKFTLSFESKREFDYNLRTNANLLINSWGIMEMKEGTGGKITFEPKIIEGQPQLFYKVETIQKK